MKENWLESNQDGYSLSLISVEKGKPRFYLLHSHHPVLWCKGCCHRTSPHHLIPGTEVLCHNFLITHHTRLLTDDSGKWNFAEQRQSEVSGMSFAPYLWNYLQHLHMKAGNTSIESHMKTFYLSSTFKNKSLSTVNYDSRSMWMNEQIDFKLMKKLCIEGHKTQR